MIVASVPLWTITLSLISTYVPVMSGVALVRLVVWPEPTTVTGPAPT